MYTFLIRSPNLLRYCFNMSGQKTRFVDLLKSSTVEIWFCHFPFFKLCKINYQRVQRWRNFSLVIFFFWQLGKRSGGKNELSCTPHYSYKLEIWSERSINYPALAEHRTLGWLWRKGSQTSKYLSITHFGPQNEKWLS